jgi:site-specific DNA recombinase
MRPVAEFSDEGISGAAIGNRPAIQRLQQQAFAREFDVILVTDLSRLSRNQGDLLKLIERLRFRGVRVLGVQDAFDSDARVARMQAGLSGIIGEEFRATIKDRTYSALQMRAKNGAPTGGRPYGYDSKRQPVEPEASIAREIFTRYAAGESQHAIASDLNRRGVPSPGASWHRASRRSDGRWLVSAIHAILHNEMYVGRLVWNRSEWIKDPESGRRIRRERPKGEWVVHEVPSAAIVDSATWDRVQSRHAARTEPNRAAGNGRGGKPRFLLSGLLECGLCGAKMIIKGAAPRHYYICGTYHAGGPHACGNRQTARRDLIEDVLLEPVKKQVLSPEAVEFAISVIRELWQQRQAQQPTDCTPEIPRLDNEIEQFERLVSMGVLSPGVGAAGLEKARRDRAALVRAMAPRSITPMRDFAIHAEAAYQSAVGRLGDVLRGANVSAAREALRPIIGTIRCTPEPRGDYLVAEFGLNHGALLKAAVGGDWVGSGGALCENRIDRVIPFARRTCRHGHPMPPDVQRCAECGRAGVRKREALRRARRAA